MAGHILIDDPLRRNVPNLPIQHDGAEVVTNEVGGKQSRLGARYDLLPPFAETLVAQVLAHGAEKYGEWNWRNLPTSDHINHTKGHIAAAIADDQQDLIIPDVSAKVNHLAKVACRALFALETAYLEEQN